MKCIFCGESSRVRGTITEDTSNNIFRERVCMSCGKMFYTREECFSEDAERLYKTTRSESYKKRQDETVRLAAIELLKKRFGENYKTIFFDKFAEVLQDD